MKINPVLCISRHAIVTVPPENESGMYVAYFDFEKVDPSALHLINRSVVDSKEPELLTIGKALPQVLPYALVRCGDEFLTYSRAKGNEDRLHGSLSLGFGGHIELEDVSAISLNLASGLLRELNEEVGLDINQPFTLSNMFTALIDNTNEVGSVHLGVLYELKVDDKSFINPDLNEIHLPVWQTIDQIVADKDRYENWSQLLINSMQ